MARRAGILRSVEYHLSTFQTLDACRCLATTFMIDSTVLRAHQHACCWRGSKKSRAIGRSRGGLATKMHVIVTPEWHLAAQTAMHGCSNSKNDGSQRPFQPNATGATQGRGPRLAIVRGTPSKTSLRASSICGAWARATTSACPCYVHFCTQPWRSSQRGERFRNLGLARG